MADEAKRLFQKYVDTATELAESVKRNIIKDGVIDDRTVNKLNDFIIATNDLANMPIDDIELNSDENEKDPTLN